MRFSKKSLLSASLAVVMAAGSVAIPVAVNAVDNTEAAAVSNRNTGYNLASSVENGNILHAFNWYFNDVKKYMKDIAEAGFTTVQVSPVQANKTTINSGLYACDWWVTYQPINFEVGNNYGTKADFKAMCDEADKYGIKIIVDVVANHMAQADGGSAGQIADSVIADLRDDADCWHQTSKNVTDSNRYAMTQFTLSGIPDLNTANEKVQSYVKGLLKECVDYGADGFRFDAAKHIELDTDPDVNGVHYASDFWKNVTSYAKEIKPDVFLYGEILAPFATDASNYTQYMRITDSAYGTKVANAAGKGTNSPSLKNYNVTGASASDLVLWVESHDNFISGQSATAGLKKSPQVVLGWGLVGARENAPALYFVRPEHESLATAGGSMTIKYDELMGGPGSLYWKDPTVVAVNRFKNQFEGQPETLYTDTKLFGVQRGTTGIVLTNYNTADYEANLQTTLEDGTYTDQVSGAEFTVANGVLSGTVKTKSVAVLCTPEKSALAISAKLDGNDIKTSGTDISFSGETAKFTCLYDVQDAASFDISVNGVSANYGVVTDENEKAIGAEVVIGNAVNYGDDITVTVKAENAAGTITDVYTIRKKDPNAPIVAYFDTKDCENWDTASAPGIYAFAKDKDGNAIEEFPGFLMTKVPGTTYVKAELPSNTAVVKFSEGPVITGLDGRTVPATVVNYGPASKKVNREKGGLNISGSMLWSKGSWRNYNADASAFDSCTAYSFGDVNGDGKVNLKDAVLVNKCSLDIISLNKKEQYAADLDDDFEIKLIDALTLQKTLLSLDK
ncbi:MAG: alpha-amylase family glycosyl hydrolase [Acutalibacteraceae bacterium]